MKKLPMNLNKKRWAMYAAAGAAAAFSGANTAEADITHVVLDNDAGEGVVGSLGTRQFQLGNGSTLNFNNTSYTYPGYPTTNRAAAGVDLADGSPGGIGAFTNGFLYGANVAYGVNISTLASNTPQSDFAVQDNVYLAYGDPGANSGFDAGVEGFVAFSFNGGTQFGWARLTFDDDPNGDNLNTFVVNEYAFSDTAHPITVGQTVSTAVPEPTSLGLLALGAIGVLANRRRKSIA